MNSFVEGPRLARRAFRYEIVTIDITQRLTTRIEPAQAGQDFIVSSPFNKVAFESLKTNMYDTRFVDGELVVCFRDLPQDIACFSLYRGRRKRFPLKQIARLHPVR
jgi:hypothetical protein